MTAAKWMCGVALMAALVPATVSAYLLQNTGTLGGNQANYPGTKAQGISDNNIVVGGSVGSTWRAFRYEQAIDAIFTLSNPPGSKSYGYALGISSDGTMAAGNGYYANNQPAALWTDNGTAGWAATKLPAPPYVPDGTAVNRTATDVNNRGVAVGYGYGLISGYSTGPLVWHPGDMGTGWTYDAGTDYSYMALPYIPNEPNGSYGIDSRALCITDDGIIGGFGEVGSNNNRAAVWMPDGSGGYTGYNLYKDGPTEGRGGNVYGIGWDDTAGTYRAVGNVQISGSPQYWEPWSWLYNSGTDAWDSQGSLGTLGTEEYQAAYGINPDGTIVGRAHDGSGYRAFVWTQADGLVDLNSMVQTTESWLLESATGINSKGDICGYGYLDVNGDGIFSADESRSFILFTPEPASLTLVGAALMLLVRRRV